MVQPEAAKAVYERSAANPLGPIPTPTTNVTSSRMVNALDLAMAGICPWCQNEDCFVQVTGKDDNPIAICLFDDCSGSFQSRGIVECVPTVAELRAAQEEEDDEEVLDWSNDQELYDLYLHNVGAF